MNQPKSSIVPKVAAILLLAIVAACLFFVLRPKPSVVQGASQWDRCIIISGDAGTQLRCWLNREGVSEFHDLQAPTNISIPDQIISVEIRHTGTSGRLDLKIRNQKGESATTALTEKDQFADLFISEKTLVWSRNMTGRSETVAQLRLKP